MYFHSKTQNSRISFIKGKKNSFEKVTAMLFYNCHDILYIASAGKESATDYENDI